MEKASLCEAGDHCHKVANVLLHSHKMVILKWKVSLIDFGNLGSNLPNCCQCMLIQHWKEGLNTNAENHSIKDIKGITKLFSNYA